VSLYGTGRREGIVTVLTLAGLVCAVHALAAWRAPSAATAAWGWIADAVLPALAGALCYRFLRAQGRSRYAGFLAGAAYALSPWLLALDLVPAEQFAAALAPLALEAAQRCGRPQQRPTWLPWTGLCLAAPFAAGVTVVAAATAVLAVVVMVHDVVHGDRDDRPAHTRGVVRALGFAVAAATTLLLAAPVAGAFVPGLLPQPAEVLAAHRPGARTIDVAALLRLPGAVLLYFATLGILRRQRYVDAGTWLGLAVGGVLVSTCADLVPATVLTAIGAPWLLLLPTAGWWLALVAITVLGAAGLDDFLDLPMRRRSAVPWLLAGIVMGAPLILASGSTDPDQEWPLSGTLLLLAVLLPTWRRLGILRFKNVLATAVLLALVVPAVQVLLQHPSALPGAAPAGETTAGSGFSWAASLPPLSDYRALLVVLAITSVGALSAFRRNTKARPAPSSAKAAIKKKAKPAARS
jgi:hypothetical protein